MRNSHQTDQTVQNSTTLTRSRSIGFRSNGRGGLRAKRGGGFRQARRILIRRPRMRASGQSAVGDGGGRRRAAAEIAGETQSRVLVHGLTCGLHLREAHELVKLAGAAAAAERRRGDWLTRQHGLRSPAKVRQASTDDTARGVDNT
jgi:hypothetical protein